MALRNALTRVAGPLRGAVQSAALHQTSVIGPSIVPVGHQTRSYRNRVENELYDRSRQEYTLGNRVPSVAPDAWIAPNATLIGDTDVADQCSVWHGTVLKGDLGAVRMGAFSNVQERCVLDAAGAATRIGQYVTIGTCTSISSAVVEDNVLIGARCVLGSGSYVEENAALEAGTVVEQGQLIPSGQLWGGNPARYVRDLDGNEVLEIQTIAKNVYGTSQDHASQTTPWGLDYVQTEALRKALGRE